MPYTPKSKKTKITDPEKERLFGRLLSNDNIDDINGIANVANTNESSIGSINKEISTINEGVSIISDEVSVLSAAVSSISSSVANKQDLLVSGANIKTIEGHSILGSGNVDISKSDVGLSNVDNTSDANKPISLATQLALNSKEDTISLGTNSQYFRGDKTFQVLDKIAVGLSNVDNTSDADKPVSTAQASAIGLKQDVLVSGTNIKTINGISILGSGDVPISGSAPSGTLVLVNANEVNSNGGTAFTVKSYTMPENTYSRILIESECEFYSGTNILSTCDFAIYVGGVVKRIVENVNSATGAGDYVRTGIAIKYSEAIPSGALIELRTQNVSNATFVVNSLRIYGVI